MSKARPEIQVGAGFIVFAALLYFFDGSGLVSAIVPAVAAHELGHALALRLAGARVTRVSFDVRGIVMDYAGAIGTGAEVVSAAAGPVFGLLFAVFASYAGRTLGSEFWLCSSGVSLILSVYNLLPSPPLDGGRILALVLTRRFGAGVSDAVTTALGLATAALLVTLGTWYLSRGYGAALVFAGVSIFSFVFIRLVKSYVLV